MGTFFEKKDAIYMLYALSEAVKGIGKTTPNPLVGAVIVKNGKIISTGYHEKAGLPHAEAIAIEKAGRETKGSTMYVTLEPCVHHGKTPPCAPRIVKAGIKQVIIGTKDPNPLVNGKGIKFLQEHKVKVKVGILENKVSFLNRGFFKRIKTGLPWVTLKIAVGSAFDIKTPRGKRYISSKSSLEITHALRAHFDLLALGSKTALTDNPKLNVRLSSPSVQKLVIDPKVVLFSRKNKANFLKRFLRKYRTSPVFEKRIEGTVNLRKFRDFLKEQGKRGINYVLVEGGARVANFLLREEIEKNEGILDEIYIFYTAAEAKPPKLMRNSLNLKKFPIRITGKSGEDFLLYFSKKWFPT